MASDIKEAIRRLIYQYTVEGADKVMATQEAVAASTTKTDKASLSLEKSFGSLERRYVETVRSQQDYAKVQDKVNAAVAQNPALQERANVVLAQAKQHFDNMATGADKGSIAATALARTLSRTIGPLALIGVAVAAVSSALEFMEPIAVRVGADIYRRFSEAYPAVAQFVDGIAKAGKEFVELEHAKAKVEAIDAAMRGVASSAQLAALKVESLNEKLVNQRGMAEMAQAQQRMADHVTRLAQIYPGVTQEVTKQLELLDAQLVVARARTEEEKQIAEEKVRQVQLTQQGISGDEQQLIIARERAIAEAEVNKQREKSVYYSQNQTAATNDISAAQANVTDEAENTTNEIHSAGSAIRNNIVYTKQWTQAVEVLGFAAQDFNQAWGSFAAGAAGHIATPIQFGDQTFESSYDPLRTQLQKATMEQLYGAGNIEPIFASGGAIVSYKPTQDYLDAQNKLADATEENTSATDALNNTMQNALSPFYSQDPRTTHLGFRAGVVGNPEWQVGGASNTNPLAAILGAGATAPGMANGGSFMVGGGYSANDNRIAAFPVASGEEVIVNRNRKGGAGGQVIHIDNRTIINGRVDADVFAQMKVSKYQQTQRMRAGLAVA